MMFEDSDTDATGLYEKVKKFCNESKSVKGGY